jgi:polyisoprenoid-binding protein YceI
MQVVSGEITIDPAPPQATVIATLDAASFSTGNRTRDRDIRSAKFLDAENHPRIVFRAGTLSNAGGRRMLSGELTVRDVSRPVTLAVGQAEPDGNGFRVRATARIDRYAFGLTAAKGMAARFLDIDVTAVAEPQQ